MKTCPHSYLNCASFFTQICIALRWWSCCCCCRGAGLAPPCGRRDKGPRHLREALKPEDTFPRRTSDRGCCCFAAPLAAVEPCASAERLRGVQRSAVAAAVVVQPSTAAAQLREDRSRRGEATPPGRHDGAGGRGVI